MNPRFTHQLKALQLDTEAVETQKTTLISIKATPANDVQTNIGLADLITGVFRYIVTNPKEMMIPINPMVDANTPKTLAPMAKDHTIGQGPYNWPSDEHCRPITCDSV